MQKVRDAHDPLKGLRVNVLNDETYRGNNEKINSAHTLGLGRP